MTTIFNTKISPSTVIYIYMYMYILNIINCFYGQYSKALRSKLECNMPGPNNQSNKNLIVEFFNLTLNSQSLKFCNPSIFCIQSGHLVTSRESKFLALNNFTCGPTLRCRDNQNILSILSPGTCSQANGDTAAEWSSNTTICT